MAEKSRYAILVAGGQGARFGGSTPKQFLPLGGRPVLLRAMERFVEFDPQIHLVLVLPKAEQGSWQQIVENFSDTPRHSVAVGGQTRFHSVLNALQTLAGSGLVAVHDGVRPLVSSAVIAACFEAAGRTGAAVPVVPLSDSIRRCNPDGTSAALDRAQLCAVQTPQVFDLNLLQAAYRLPYRNSFTDDASVVEAAGHSVALVSGNPENIKITTPTDLLLAEVMLQLINEN